MKLKSSQLSHKVIILIENYERGLRVYYSDGHFEVLDTNIQNIAQKRINFYKYKNPIVYKGTLLHPTQNKKDEQCQWINLDYLEEKDFSFLRLLEKKNLISKVQNMYFKYKKEMFLQTEDKNY